MKKLGGFGLIVVLGFLWATQVRAADQATATNDTPVILASLDVGVSAILDDVRAADVRGQAPQYVMVKHGLLGNFLDTFVGKGASWAFYSPNPISINPIEALLLFPFWRYGNWGGLGWSGGSDGKGSPVDTMDTLFRTHDNAIGWNILKLSKANAELGRGLSGLPNFTDKFWGPTYVSSPAGAPSGVNVYTLTAMTGGKRYWGFRELRFSEYARRQARTVFK